MNRVLHGYTLLRRAGTGGVGEVWEALAPDGGRVAVKRLHVHLERDVVSRERLRREGEALARVEHPRVVGLIEVRDEPPALVLEWVEGGTLGALLEREGALPVPRATEILCGILEGLAAVHAVGLVHRDLKPPNVLLPDDGPVLADFGIVGELRRTEPRLTPVGRTMTTPSYASPELIHGGAHEIAADLWAAAVVFYECVAGASPFEGATVIELYQRIVRAEVPPLRAFREGVPDGLDALFARLLAADVAQRPRDAAEALAWVRSVRE